MDGGRRAEHRGDDQVGGGVRDQGGDKHRVERQHRAGDAGHTAGHHHEQLAARQAREVRLDEQGGFDHADEDVGRGRQADSAADLHRALEGPGEAAHHRR
jgi:hypothetical protein